MKRKRILTKKLRVVGCGLWVVRLDINRRATRRKNKQTSVNKTYFSPSILRTKKGKWRWLFRPTRTKFSTKMLTRSQSSQNRVWMGRYTCIKVKAS